MKDENETVHADELKLCPGILDYNQRNDAINHSEDVWLVGDVYTNSIENIWVVYSSARSTRQPERRVAVPSIRHLRWPSSPHLPGVSNRAVSGEALRGTDGLLLFPLNKS